MNIHIKVFRFNRQAQHEVLYSTHVEVHDDVHFPFDKVNEILRLLYPKSSGVEFCVM